MDKWKWNTLERKGGLKHLDTWMVSLDIYFSFFDIFKEFVLVSPRCWQDSEWRTMTYEKVWVNGVEWLGGGHG